MAKVCSQCHRACLRQFTSELFEEEVFCCETCMEKFTERKRTTQTRSWCGSTGNMEYAAKCEPSRYFCNEHCLNNWHRFNTKPE